MGYRYIGNKTRLLPQLMSAINALVPAGSVIADLMCGTGAVSEALRVAGHRVVASDLMTYAVHHARVRLTLSAPPAFEGLGGCEYPMLLQQLNSLPGHRGFFHRELSPQGQPAARCRPRQYFSAENAAHIDAIQAWFAAHRSMLSLAERSLLRHDLILAANDVANIAGTYGHYRSKWNKASLRPLRLLPAELVDAPTRGHRVLQGPAEQVAQGLGADLCYLDPPYMKRQYAANYHVLETLARGDVPDAVGVSGLRDWWDQYSDFCSKRKIRDAFAAIIQGMDCPLFLVSYSEDGLLDSPAMLETLGRFGEVTGQEFRFQRFRSNDSPLRRELTEYLFLLRKA